MELNALGGAGEEPSWPARMRARIAGGLPLVLLAGRTNVGKSSLFNRLTASGRALVSPAAGTTRDLRVAEVRHRQFRFALADAGGLQAGAGAGLEARVRGVVLEAACAADLVLVVFDAQAGPTVADELVVDALRRLSRPLLAVVNKVDRGELEAAALSFHALGFERLFMVSAAHGRGIGEMLGAVAAALPAREDGPAVSPVLRLALIGRPNVGKSSLFNRLCGFPRSLVDRAPGTTRDAVEIALAVEGQRVLLVDTAGIRRPSRVDEGLERQSVGRAMEAARQADVLGLVADAGEGLTEQDVRLARLVDRRGRALVVVCNKWDLARGRGAALKAFAEAARRRFPFLGRYEMVFTSALSGDGVDGIGAAALRAAAAWRSEFKTAALNRLLGQAVAALEPPLIGGRRLKLYYVAQVGSAPPRLVLFANMERGVPPAYLRYLEGRLRAAYALTGTPLVLEVRARKRREHGPRPAGAPLAEASGAPARRARPPSRGRRRGL